MNKIKATKKFKQQFKRVRRDSRWRPIFYGTVPFDEQHSPWEFITQCFLQNKAIPDYFYPHLLSLSKKEQQSLKKV